MDNEEENEDNNEQDFDGFYADDVGVNDAVEDDMEEGDEGGLRDRGYTGDLLGYNANDPFIEECFQVPDGLDVSKELSQHGPLLYTRTSGYCDGAVIEIFPNYFFC